MKISKKHFAIMFMVVAALAGTLGLIEVFSAPYLTSAQLLLENWALFIAMTVAGAAGVYLHSSGIPNLPIRFIINLMH